MQTLRIESMAISLKQTCVFACYRELACRNHSCQGFRNKFIMSTFPDHILQAQISVQDAKMNTFLTQQWGKLGGKASRVERQITMLSSGQYNSIKQDPTSASRDPTTPPLLWGGKLQQGQAEEGSSLNSLCRKLSRRGGAWILRGDVWGDIRRAEGIVWAWETLTTDLFSSRTGLLVSF